MQKVIYLRIEANKMIYIYIRKLFLIFIGIILSLILIEFGLHLSGYLVRKYKYLKIESVSFDSNEYRILCLGESTTQGFRGSSYPSLLQEILNNKSKLYNFKVINEGEIACNSTMILNGLDEKLLKFKPHMVVSMMGINDRYMNEIFISKSRFDKSNFMDNIKIIKFIKWSKLFAKTKLSNIKVDPTANKGTKENDNIIDNVIYLRETGRYDEAIMQLKEEITENQNHHQLLEELWVCYLDQRKFDEAETYFNNYIEKYSLSIEVQEILGDLYIQQGRYKEAIEIYNDLLNLNSHNSMYYCYLGICYNDTREYEKEKEIYIRALENECYSEDIFCKLANYYLINKNYNKVKEVYLKSIDIYPKNKKLLNALMAYYIDIGDYKKAESIIQEEGVNEITEYNYLKLYKILKKNKIKYVCMQYPLCSINELKELFKDKKDVIFVENKDNFIESLKTLDFVDLFYDNFAGCFGHCKYKGDYLIAENLANTILKELIE
ncbi:MAG: tetratricopeptide repeat protein [Endomicrobiales bacterium]|nr:tetratricopeptide repeat protein [Endomicrobiales bacterium]